MDKSDKNPIVDALLKLLDQPEKCDVKFNIHLGGDTWMPFWGHKLILCLWSPVFAARFSEEKNDESLSEIDIYSVPPTVFKSFLRFMYASSEGISGNKNNGKFLLDLYKIAESYQVEQLKKECRKILIAATVQCENVFQFLNAANYIDLEIVKLRCFELIRYKTADVLAVQDLKKITPFMVFTVLKLDTLSLTSEYDLLSWVYEWAENECNNTPETKPQEIIKPFLPYLNFVSLKAEQFAALVNKHKPLFDSDDSFKIFLNICDPGSDCMPLPTWHNEAKNFRSYNTRIFKNPSGSQKQKDIPPVELSCSSDVMTDKPLENVKDQKDNVATELLNHSLKDSNSKSEDVAEIDDPADDKSFINLKPEEYQANGVLDSISSLEQLAVSLSENSSLVQDLENEFERELNCYSLNEYCTDNSQISIDYSKLKRKFKKKKLLKWYLLPDGKFEPNAKSMNSLDNERSGDFENLIGMVWKQHLALKSM